MKKLAIAFAALIAVLVLAQHADAFQVQLAVKQISVNFAVTPSPIVYVPTTTTGRVIAAADRAPSRAPLTTMAMLSGGDPLAGMLAYDPFSLGDMVATNPQGSAKVQFTVKIDPTYQYFHLIPGSTSTFNAGYGSNTYTCAYKVFAYYTTAWTVTDYAYGSNTSGGTAGLNGFPMYNYATTSDLAWLAETVTTSFKAFANAGSPGETTFTGTAGQTRTICIDLQLSVPANIPAGTYTATISYRMIHN